MYGFGWIVVFGIPTQNRFSADIQYKWYTSSTIFRTKCFLFYIFTCHIMLYKEHEHPGMLSYSNKEPAAIKDKTKQTKKKIQPKPSN